MPGDRELRHQMMKPDALKLIMRLTPSTKLQVSAHPNVTYFLERVRSGARLSFSTQIQTQTLIAIDRATFQACVFAFRPGR